MTASSAAFKQWKESATIVFVDLTDRSQFQGLPASAKELRPKGKISWPYAMVVSPDLKRGICFFEYQALKENIAMAASGLAEQLSNQPELLSSPHGKEAEIATTGVGTEGGREANRSSFLIPSRNWTNLQGEQMTAALVDVRKSAAIFLLPDGSKTSYELGKLIPADRREILSARDAKGKRTPDTAVSSD